MAKRTTYDFDYTTMMLSKNTYDILFDLFVDAGAELLTGEHEGSSLILADVLLCESDGSCWIAVV